MTKLIQEYFSQSAARFPDKVAVACRKQTVTFGELEAETNRWARALQSRGLGRGEFVPFFMKKGIPSIRSILTILKADCAYVPLDVASPPERLLEILDSTNARFVLADSNSLERLRQITAECTDLTIVNIDDSDSLVDISDSEIPCENLSLDIAYVLFTSGSTGKPKGVMIAHQMIVDYIDWCVETYTLGPDDQIANHAPLYFDNSTFDLYTAFKTGATLHLVHDELNLIMIKLLPWLERNAITVFFCVPSVLNILLKSGKLTPGLLPAMRHVIAAGEALPPDVLREWMKLYPDIQFTNMYGPTEITVDCTFHVVPEAPAAGSRSIPIGIPRNNMEVFVELEGGELSKQPGAEGELIVRGKSVSYGYLNDPEKTREAFFQNPRHDHFHDPLYRTGDLARIGDDGAFHFIGRRDQQIKYMGNRIELGEIESVLIALPGVRDGVVLFNDSPVFEEKCIAALVSLEPGVDRADLSSALRNQLPTYMVPHKIVVADVIPQTPNGKADRKAAFALIFPD